MALTLSTAELSQLERSIKALVSPLDYSSLDLWRSEVNRAVKALVHADSAGFALPVRDGLVLFSEEHDPRELAKYPDYPPPPTVDGTPLWEGMIRDKVITNATWYGEHYHLYTDSAYYNEFAGANRAHDTLAASMSLGGLDARTMASLVFWHERPNGRLFGERELALLKLLYPAFCAGVRSSLWWREQAQDLNSVLDGLKLPTLVATARGSVVYVSRLLDELMADDPDAMKLKCALRDAVDELADVGGRMRVGTMTGATSRQFATASARYRIAACRFGERVGSGGGYIIVGLERLSARLPSLDELRARFRLTPAESRVARCIAEGLTAKQIAERLEISAHTVHRHTEKVLQKLNAKSRTEATARIFG